MSSEPSDVRDADEERLRRLEASEAHYRALAEASPDVIIRYDLTGRITYVSPAVRRYGAEPDEVIGTNVADYLEAEALPRNDAFMAELAAGRLPPQGEANVWRVRTGEGTWAYAEGATNPVVEDGRVVGAISVLRDVTSRIALEAALREKQLETERALSRLAESEARYRTVVDTVGDAIIWCDVRGYVEFVSSAISLFGYRPEDLVGRHVLEFVHADDYRGDVPAAIREGRPPPRGPENEFRMLRGDGEWAWAQANPMPLYGADGALRGVLNVVRDITDQRRLEEELRAKRREAEAAMVAKSDFLATVSHEIRTPLTAVLGFAELLLRSPELPASTRSYVERMQQGGETLRTVLDSVLDYSKIQAGQIELEPKSTHLRELLASTVGLFAPLARAKDLALALQVAEDAPDRVLVDRGRFAQALGVLLDNAVKFTQEGSVTVEAAFHPGAQMLELSVTDTGIGIDPATQETLFTAFTQGESTNARRYGGVGLGLAVSRGLARLMGGDVEADGSEGAGARFRLRIHAPRAGEDLNSQQLESAPLRPIRILVVDDAPINRELIVALLSPLGAHFEEAGDGVQALEAAVRRTFDLILMDIQMPVLDGIAAAAAIRSSDGPNRETPIVAVSASVQPRDVEACRAAGMNDHVAKPLNIQDLTEKVLRWTLEAATPLAEPVVQAAGR